MKKLSIVIMLLLMSKAAFTQSDTTSNYLKIGGAIRFNYLIRSWDADSKKRGGDFWYDMFRLNIDAEYNRVITSVEGRFYSNDFGGLLIHHAWMGYRFKNEDQIQLGISKVPFGILPYASHNWFFNIHYYLGLEDDYDLGVKYLHEDDKWKYAIAFYKTSEMPASNFSRYSYDVSDTHDEQNTLNIRLARQIGMTEIGVSGQIGQLENTQTNEFGNHGAFAAHINTNLSKLNVMLQYIYYEHNPADPDPRTVRMSAYGAAYNVASIGSMYSLGLSYPIDVGLGPFKKLNIYYNFGYIDKSEATFNDSYMSVAGTSLEIGPVFTYIDWASGLNHPWIGADWQNGFGEGNFDATWHHRFNINFGYYF